MAKYRKVSVQMWNDAKFRSLSDDGKLVFIFVLTHPHMTSVGGMRGTLAGLAAELGWQTERLSKAFSESSERGSIWYDDEACFIAFPNFVKHNQPESPNVVKAWEKAFSELPESRLKSELYKRVEEEVKKLPPVFRKSFGSLSEVFSNQEQEQEQDLKEELSEKPKPVSPDSLFSLPCEDGSEFVYDDIFIAAARKAYPLTDITKEIAKARAWLEGNPTRKKTRKGMKKFFNGWLARTQSDAEKNKAANATVETTGRELTAEDMKPAKWLREAKI